MRFYCILLQPLLWPYKDLSLVVVSLLAHEYNPDSIPLLLSLHFFSYINLVRFYLHQILSDLKLFVFYTLEQKQYDIYISI